MKAWGRSRFVWLLWLALGMFGPLFAQSTRPRVSQLKDTLSISTLDRWSFRQYGVLHFNRTDTGWGKVLKLDPGFQPSGSNSSLGNLGTAILPLQFSSMQAATDEKANLPHSGFRFLEAYQFLPEHLPQYLTARSLTNITYQLGSLSEHYFSVQHSQQISPSFHIGAAYRHINSAGAYRRQDAVHHNAAISIRYTSPNQRYMLLGQVIHNARNLQENGGLLNDSTFIREGLISNGNFFPNLNRATYPVRLEGAGRVGFDNHIAAEHQYQLIRSGGPNGRPRLALFHAFHHRSGEDRFRQTGNLLTAWPQVLFDSSLTKHQLQWASTSNELALRLYLREKHSSGSPLVAGIRHSAYTFFQHADSLQGDSLEVHARTLETSGQHVEVFGSLRYDLGEKVYAEAQGSLVLSGFNQGNVDMWFRMEAGADTSSHRLSLFSRFRNHRADLLAHRFVSNHAQWDLSLSPQQTIEVRGKWQFGKNRFALGSAVWLVNQYVYFQDQSTPQQATDAALVAEAQAQARFRFGKFGCFLQATGQYSSASYLPLSPFMAQADVYFQTRMFKNNLLLRLGLDMYYLSPFQAPVYDPLTSRFMVQNSLSTGGYPFGDVYVAAKISHVRFWFKLRNVNQRFPGIPYFITPHHPMQDRSIQVGLTWHFYG